jgi:hypothetical protein
MRKLVLLALVAALPAFVPLSDANAFGWCGGGYGYGYSGYGYAPRAYGYYARPRVYGAYYRPRVYGWRGWGWRGRRGWW